LFAASDEPETAPEPTMPTIIDVPQWLSRLEPKLAAADRDEPAVVEERSERVRPSPDDPPAKQQRLF